jgi:hypothetical protein
VLDLTVRNVTTRIDEGTSKAGSRGNFRIGRATVARSFEIAVAQACALSKIRVCRQAIVATVGLRSRKGNGFALAATQGAALDDPVEGHHSFERNNGVRSYAKQVRHNAEGAAHGIEKLACLSGCLAGIEGADSCHGHLLRQPKLVLFTFDVNACGMKDTIA